MLRVLVNAKRNREFSMISVSPLPTHKLTGVGVISQDSIREVEP